MLGASNAYEVSVAVWSRHMHTSLFVFVQIKADIASSAFGIACSNLQ